MSWKSFFGKKEEKKKRDKQRAKDLGLSEKEFEEIRRAFNTFDQDEDGRISRNELRSVVRMLGHNIPEADLEDMMRQTDGDGSGSIDFEEFLPLIIARMKKATSKTTTTTTKTKMTSQEKEMRDAFRAFDQNGDGVISISELRQAMAKMGQRLSDAEIANIIRDVDKDGDGYVNYEEFTKYIYQGPQ